MSEQLAQANKEKLVSDLKIVVSDAEELLRATAGAAGEKAGELRERIANRLRDAKERLKDAEAALVDKTKAAARATDDFQIVGGGDDIGGNFGFAAHDQGVILPDDRFQFFRFQACVDVYLKLFVTA